ncbi:unnamed protein product [Brassicogethes aeneus]|uniref:Cytochrome b5 heme-binding domain-containing protein n=1 Tax=Brassicogethes aeneus TaxID=1431903 RepID=A0A9P0FE04_BRAAE|nr:unnamed protein product [Brassicogethes aeneus]
MLKQFLIVTLISVLLSYFFGDKAFGIIGNIFFKTVTHKNSKIGEPVLLTKQVLQKFNGIHSPELYLSICGDVYDVTKGFKHYGPGESYNFFVGKDSTRSFVTGKSEEDVVSEHVADLDDAGLRSLNYWIKFYGDTYKKIGKLVGKYYNNKGDLTEYAKQVKKLIDAAENQKKSEELEKAKFPPCNVEWDQESGSRYWCSNKSGGIHRNWVGKPRKLYEAGAKDYRCACIDKSNAKLGNVQQFENCDENSESCYVKQ